MTFTPQSPGDPKGWRDLIEKGPTDFRLSAPGVGSARSAARNRRSGRWKDPGRQRYAPHPGNQSKVRTCLGCIEHYHQSRPAPDSYRHELSTGLAQPDDKRFSFDTLM